MAIINTPDGGFILDESDWDSPYDALFEEEWGAEKNQPNGEMDTV